MADTNETRDAQSAAAPANERDPYPRMIIACIVVSMSLFLIMLGVTLYDFLSRQARTAPVDGKPVVGLPPQPFRATEDAASGAAGTGAGTATKPGQP